MRETEIGHQEHAIEPDMSSIEGIAEALAFVLDYAPSPLCALSALGLMSSAALQALPVEIRRPAFEHFIDTLTLQVERSLAH